MRKAFLVCALLFLYFTTAAAHSASFDCKKASTEAEKKICADAQLARLDEELAAAYRGADGKADRTGKAILRKDQAAWLKARNACKENLCIEVIYRTKLAMLAAAAAQAGAPDMPGYGKFWLTYGRGVKVCEAYLERLNRSSYEHHPKCDRPENDEVAGFRALSRVKLSAEELEPFWPSISTFLASGKVQDWQRGDEESQKLEVRPRFGRNVEERLKELRSESTLAVYRYQEPIDIDNDGVADPVVIWRSGNCKRFGPVDKMFYWDSIPVVLNAVRDGPDVERTRMLFGHPSGAYRSFGWPRIEFRPIGKTMGIFQFNGTYYMDTFFDVWGDFHDRRRDAPELSPTNQSRQSEDPEIPNRLGVFLRGEGETKQVCEYWFEDFSKARTRAMRQ